MHFLPSIIQPHSPQQSLDIYIYIYTYIYIYLSLSLYPHILTYMHRHLGSCQACHLNFAACSTGVVAAMTHLWKVADFQAEIQHLATWVEKRPNSQVCGNYGHHIVLQDFCC